MGRLMPGDRWRVLAHRKDGTQAEMQNDGCFDELVVDDWLHIEQTDNRHWWAQICDAGVWIHIPVRGEPVLTIERDAYFTRTPQAKAKQDEIDRCKALHTPTPAGAPAAGDVHYWICMAVKGLETDPTPVWRGPYIVRHEAEEDAERWRHEAFDNTVHEKPAGWVAPGKITPPSDSSERLDALHWCVGSCAAKLRPTNETFLGRTVYAVYGTIGQLEALLGARQPAPAAGGAQREATLAERYPYHGTGIGSPLVPAPAVGGLGETPDAWRESFTPIPLIGAPPAAGIPPCPACGEQPVIQGEGCSTCGTPAAGAKPTVRDIIRVSEELGLYDEEAGAATPGDDLRLRIKEVLRDELLHPAGERGEMEAWRAIERAMSVVDKVFALAQGGKADE